MAMTRAKKGLYFTSAEDYGGARSKKLSRFMMELGYPPKADQPGAGKDKNELLESKYQKPDTRKPENQKISYQLPNHFSFSQLAAFEKCPLQYKFAFILRVPVKGKAVFSFGKTMHSTLYQFLKNANEASKQKQDNLFGFKDLETKFPSGSLVSITNIYEQNWIDEWYGDKKQKEEYYERGKKIVKDFYADFLKNPPKILTVNNALALEMPFNLKISGNTIKGQIDRIDEVVGGVVILDYKTGEAKEKLDSNDKEQLLLYQIAAEEVFGLKPKGLVYHYIRENKKQSFLGSDKEKSDLKEKIQGEIEAIKNSNFDPTPGWQCSFCDFKDICEFAER